MFKNYYDRLKKNWCLDMFSLVDFPFDPQQLSICSARVGIFQFYLKDKYDKNKAKITPICSIGLVIDNNKWKWLWKSMRRERQKKDVVSSFIWLYCLHYRQTNWPTNYPTIQPTNEWIDKCYHRFARMHNNISMSIIIRRDTYIFEKKRWNPIIWS